MPENDRATPGAGAVLFLVIRAMTGEPKIRIEQTRNRHSRAVVHDDVIVIRLARGLSHTEAGRHVESLVRRMSKALEKQRELTTIDPMRPLLNGEKTLTLCPVIGAPCTFELVPGKTNRIRKTATGWTVTLGPRIRRQALHRLLWKLIAEHCRPAIETLMDDLNDQTLRVTWRELKVGYASSQWGSCSIRGIVMLNSVLLFTNIETLRYVIIHEFAHCLVRGHSRKFWKTVESACPEQKDIRKRLRKMRICRL